jgi:hypothetical protein
VLEHRGVDVVSGPLPALQPVLGAELSGSEVIGAATIAPVG